MLHEYKLETIGVLRTRYSTMLSERQTQHEGIWQEVGRYVSPRKYRDNYSSTPPSSQNAASTTPQMYDTTAVDSATTLAAGHSSAITPANSRWFSWKAPDTFNDKREDKEAANQWFNNASQTAYTVLASSNFYSAITEVYDDRSAFGISCLSVNPGKQTTLNFRAIPVGSFTCCEDEEGNVSTVFVSRQYRIDELVDLFGEEAVLANEKLAKEYEAWSTRGTVSYNEVVHAVFPRPPHVIDKGKIDSFNLPYASIYFLPNAGGQNEGEAILKRSGLHEQCYMVSRYLTKAGASPYGFSPYEEAKASINDAQKLRRILQVLAQRMALPPLLIPEQLTNQVDTNPGGRTIVPANGAVPKEWIMAADPKWIFDLLTINQDQIRKAYNTDMFRMFSERTKQMTVREVSELAAEKLMPFGPSFAKFTSDFRTAMERIFGICLRAGVFGEQDRIPQAILTDLGASLEVKSPKIIYQSRMALAYRNQEIGAVDRMLERVANMAQIKPEVLDNVDVDFCARDTARGDGVPEGALVPYSEVLKARKDAAAQQQAQAMMQAQMAMQAQQPPQPGAAPAGPLNR